jgi:hypothetical protein
MCVCFPFNIRKNVKKNHRRNPALLRDRIRVSVQWCNENIRERELTGLKFIEEGHFGDSFGGSDNTTGLILCTVTPFP